VWGIFEFILDLLATIYNRGLNVWVSPGVISGANQEERRVLFLLFWIG